MIIIQIITNEQKQFKFKKFQFARIVYPMFFRQQQDDQLMYCNYCIREARIKKDSRCDSSDFFGMIKNSFVL